ncbi:glycosyl transferase family 1 [Mycobacterium adipatum]|uniref:Glycosyl transferase family 1 n=1 Tax=Mycobacterium adipatum TaxID=1682113 RepID=A0A172URX8_9MYCO|nr:glycosyltransferase [Mycobacterium adipatum]ANE81795.1 glycosyl transferase family 1 [Mycobacterium adipatum]MBI5735464.1 glycosyltransferase [Mycolicibacterium neoaurum]
MPEDRSAPPHRYDGSDGPRVAIAHDYLTQRGGAEKVVLSMSKAFPDAPIYTLLYDPEGTYPEFADRDIRVSPLNRVSAFRKHHRAALPVLPFTASAMFVDADVVVTSSSGWAHGFRTNGVKLVHCHTPAHWLYAREHYLKPDGDLLKRAALKVGSPLLKSWDRRAASSVDRYLAVSTAIKHRIRDAYGIDADVLPSPIAMKPHTASEPVPELQDWATDGGAPFYLCVSRLMAYKNVDAVVGAFADTDRRLVVVGHGPEATRIERMKTPNVRMLSALTDGQMAWLYQSCRALIAASYEDFGLTPIEAAVSGRPAVVLRWGGFLDTVIEGTTGMFFDRPAADSIAEALDRFEACEFDPDKLRSHAQRFTEQRYAESLYAAVDALTAQQNPDRAG